MPGTHEEITRLYAKLSTLGLRGETVSVGDENYIKVYGHNSTYFIIDYRHNYVSDVTGPTPTTVIRMKCHLECYRYEMYEDTSDSEEMIHFLYFDPSDEEQLQDLVHITQLL